MGREFAWFDVVHDAAEPDSFITFHSVLDLGETQHNVDITTSYVYAAS